MPNKKAETSCKARFSAFPLAAAFAAQFRSRPRRRGSGSKPRPLGFSAGCHRLATLTWVEQPSVAAQPGLVPWVSAWALPALAAVQPMAEPAAQAFSGRVVARALDAMATLLSVSRIATQPTPA